MEEMRPLPQFLGFLSGSPGAGSSFRWVSRDKKVVVIDGEKYPALRSQELLVASSDQCSQKTFAHPISYPRENWSRYSLRTL